MSVTPPGTRPPATLADLIDGAALDEVLDAMAEFHGVALALADEEGRVLVRAGARYAVTTMGARIHIEPLWHACGCVGRLMVGPAAGSLQGELAAGSSPVLADAEVVRIARLVARVVGCALSASYTRRLADHLHVAAIEDTHAELGDVSARLAHALERMKEVDRVKTNFLANVSHELRTPLTSVLGYSEILSEGLAGELNAEQQECVRVIMEKGGQLLTLISGILDVSRIEAGTLRISAEPIDLGEEVDGVLAMLTPLAARKGVEVKGPPGLALPPVPGDREKIRQVLFHVIDNAIKFTPEGGYVEVQAGLGAVGPGGGETAIRLDVTDTGIGIHKDLIPRIFEPFFQADSSSTRPYGGTGLGLALVKNLVEAHGGRVSVVSEPGRGSVFTLTFPTALPCGLARPSRG